MTDNAKINKNRIACIGLGRMGWHIGAHLRKANPESEFQVFDVAPGVAEQWVSEHGGQAGDSVNTTAESANFIITSLPADKELQAVANNVVDVVRDGAIWIDHSTTSAQGARDIATQLDKAGMRFLDAPVSGGVDGARNGTLTVMAGGDPNAFATADPLMQAYAARTTYMGESGAGQITKMTNQICVIGLCQALAEGLDFASRAGLDVEKVLQVMQQGSSASWQMENRARQMLAGDYDFGFSTTLMRKDAGLVLDEAKRMRLPLPVTEMVTSFMADVDAMGGAQWDWCSLMESQRQRNK